MIYFKDGWKPNTFQKTPIPILSSIKVLSFPIFSAFTLLSSLGESAFKVKLFMILEKKKQVRVRTGVAQVFKFHFVFKLLSGHIRFVLVWLAAQLKIVEGIL